MTFTGSFSARPSRAWMRSDVASTPGRTRRTSVTRVARIGRGAFAGIALLAGATCVAGSGPTPEVRMDPVVARPPSASPLAVVGPLAGCWRGTYGGGGTVIEERWSPAEGGLMLGTTRYFRDGRAVDFEFSVLRADAEGVLLLPHPRGRASEHAFRLTSAEGGRWVFEAPEHDYPKRILYELEGSRLRARIDAGPDDPEPRRWQLEAAPCAL